MCEASTFLGLPFLQESLVSAYSPLRRPFFHALIWLTGEQHSGAGAAHVPHQSRSLGRECGKSENGFETADTVLPRTRGPDLSAYNISWPGRERVILYSWSHDEQSDLKKKQFYNSEWHNADPLMAEKTKVWERKNFYPIPLHRFGSRGSCTWSLKAAVSGNNFAAVDAAAATPLLFA